MIDPIPAQTLANVLEAIDLLSAIETEHLTPRGKSGAFNLLRDIAGALEHLEANHKFTREVAQ